MQVSEHSKYTRIQELRQIQTKATVVNLDKI